MALVWLLARRRQTPAVIVLLALLAGTSAAVKLGPVLVIWWLFVQGRPKAAIAATGIAAILGAASVLVAGLESFEAYLRLSAETATAGATRLSATALALNLGVPYELATYAPVACLSLAALSILGLRRRSHLAFFVALLGGVLATPVVRFESFAVLAAAGAATVSVMPQPDVRPSRQVLVRAGAVLGMLGAIGFVSWTASSTRSSLVIENRIDTPIVVRVGAVAQSATFGFRVDPKSAVRGYRLLDGGLPGLITVLVPGCGVLGTILPPAAGGHLVVEEANVVSISADLGSAVPLAAYVSDCADWPSGVGGDPR